jgi:hypothetical protein
MGQATATSRPRGCYFSVHKYKHYKRIFVSQDGLCPIKLVTPLEYSLIYNEIFFIVTKYLTLLSPVDALHKTAVI